MNDMEVAIVGIGCLSCLGNDIEDIWNMLNEPSAYQNIIYNAKYEFTSYLQGSSKRKTSRQASICRYTLEKAIEDSTKYIDTNSIDENTGTIYSSDYAALDANLKFLRQVAENDPEICSPSIFSNTVANSVLPTLCIPKQLKGVSTMLIESSSFVYARNLILEKRAKRIFAGWVSEYNEELFQDYQAMYGEQHFAEGAVSFLLQDMDEEKSKGSYCNVKNICQINLGENPWGDDDSEEKTESLIQHCIQTCLSKSGNIVPDVVISAGTHPKIEQMEAKVYSSILPDTFVIDRIASLFGAVGESSFEFGILVGSLCISHGMIPASFRKNESISDIHSVLVQGYSKIGNYTTILLSEL